ncbi:alpha/beta hydrolase [Bacillus gobiensis]|uniref:alpha/beta fold hydrolase n=1 Tax=Bacillus gobiensis TaxID=1441095 RepID=UPI003D1C09F8
MGYYVRTDQGTKLFVEDIGKGRPVLFIHGWPLNHKMFEYQFDVLPTYGVRCIGIDLRGFGRSDRPFCGYSYDRLADDIKNVVDALRLTSFTLVGFSMGGAIAIRYTSRHGRGRIRQLILAGAAAPVFTQRPDFPYGMPVEEVNKLIKQAYEDRPKMLAEFGKSFFANPISDSFQTWFFGLNLDAAGHSTIHTAVSLRDEDLRPDLKHIHAPTYILHGKKDRICPFELALQMKASIPYSALVPFEMSGHGLFYEEREKFNRELLKVIWS